MLPLPNLNDQSFSDVYEQSVKKIEKYTDSWGDVDLHDPGIMLIELFSYLKVRQQERINRVGEKSLDKFLALLDMAFEDAYPAKVGVSFISGRDTALPPGTKFKFQDVVFETTKRTRLIDNRLNDINDSYVFGKPPIKGNSFQISFEKPLPINQTVHIHIEVSSDYAVKRNELTNPEEFIATSEIAWEYYGVRDGVLGWHPLHIEDDKTYSLLFSGTLSFWIDGLHSEQDGSYPIRGRITVNLYEAAPKVINLQLNSARLVQQDTKCLTVMFSYKEFKTNKMLVDAYLAYDGIYELYIKSEGGFKKAEDLGIVYLLKEEGGLFRFGTSNRELLSSMFKSMEETDDVFKLVIYEKEFYSRKSIGVSTGFTNQIFKIKQSGVSGGGLEIMVKGTGDSWSVFRRVHSLDNSKENDEHFVFNEREQYIQLGDNEHGKVPLAYSDIIITSLKTTAGEGGNIKKGMITKPLNEELFHSVSVCQHQNAQGGKNSDTIEDVVRRIPKLFNNRKRAVTKQDYEEIAKNTQGLMIENATALPLYNPKTGERCDNAVTVVIEAFSEAAMLTDERYLQNAARELYKRKMLTTKVYVAYPLYLGLEVYCEVIVRERYEKFKALVTAEIEKHIRTLPLGGCVFYGSLCGVIENIHNVVYTKYLKIEIPLAKIKKTGMGDIEVPLHARVYVKTVDITETLME